MDNMDLIDLHDKVQEMENREGLFIDHVRVSGTERGQMALKIKRLEFKMEYMESRLRELRILVLFLLIMSFFTLWSTL